MSYGQEIFRNKYRETMDSLNIIKDNYYDLDNQYQEEMKEKDEEIERLNKENELLKSNPNFVYAMRNNKAIEYIETYKEHFKNCIYTDVEFNVLELERILKGEDNDI